MNHSTENRHNWKVATNPTILQKSIQTGDENNCPVCNTTLQKKEITIQIRDECYECIQDDRPWNIGRKNKRECYCTRHDKNILEITCETCVETQIKEKQEQEIKKKQEQDSDEQDFLAHEHMLFLSKWNNGINGKLSCYGLKKLQKLAKDKKMKGYSKLTKEQLIVQLVKVVNNSDFPIR